MERSPPEEAGTRDPDALIRRAGVRGDPNRDQHFLVDDRVVDRIPTYADEMNLEHVLEIGGGPGVLTDRLLAAADRVTVIERDPTFAEFLREEFRSECDDGGLTVVEGDALSVELPDFSACIANLPYGISSEIAFRLLPLGKPMLLMFQKEFAERMAAESGSDDYGRLSVTAQHYADVRVVETVPREAFAPQPEVESAIVRTIPREPEYEVDDEAFFLDFVKAVFTQRRKTIRNGIRNTAHISGLDDPDAVVDALESPDDDVLDEDILRERAGKVSPVEFAAMARVADELGRGGG
ncbi:dimethyladenosine transferase [Haladaptatus paucihalophilus DX253]|uniref:Probable ribosomal RNA small subunit methyltransferase A n=1 Tax=Haladaptatus paucihalophilus DX253 TaxID=797209 RepID=E7QS78_HALPU|nr:16S ribosomal RNA methyltransferase A [Haladaptatus paucihalophilus]EFW92847.1 dimethyladenosine transferase [Haladaptatus paucihalophilus DX253]SHK11061.1 dimethyladenosine transferase [Haladaptatus paucihalophilus DX253]